MYTIENQIEINANAARIVEALTTKAGIEGWWTVDCDVAGSDAAFRFEKQVGRMEVKFRIDRKDTARVAMVCVAETNNADWLGTELVFELAQAGAGTRVRLVHSGYPAKNEVYEMCTKGWTFFLGSLKSYLETGKGEPHAAPTKSIVDAVDVLAAPAKVIAALTTADGIAAWWTKTNTVSASEHVYRFGKGAELAEATFRIDRQDARGIALACTSERNGMGWLGTRLAFSVEPTGDGARVALTHAGFSLASECYDDCVGGWKHFLGSLKSYLETGTGTPHVAGTNDCH